jgi:hypothetical protein
MCTRSYERLPPLRRRSRLRPLLGRLRPSSAPLSVRVPRLPPTTPVFRFRYPLLALGPLSAKFPLGDVNTRNCCNHTGWSYAALTYFGPTGSECTSRCAPGHSSRVSRADRYGTKAGTWCPISPFLSLYHPKGTEPLRNKTAPTVAKGFIGDSSLLVLMEHRRVVNTRRKRSCHPCS